MCPSVIKIFHTWLTHLCIKNYCLFCYNVIVSWWCIFFHNLMILRAVTCTHKTWVCRAQEISNSTLPVKNHWECKSVHLSLSSRNVAFVLNSVFTNDVNPHGKMFKLIKKNFDCIKVWAPILFSHFISTLARGMSVFFHFG